MKFSASWDESHYAFRRAPSLIRNNCLTKIPANKTRQIIERPELVTANDRSLSGLPRGEWVVCPETFKGGSFDRVV